MALADCRTQNAACVKGATSPIDSVACGSLYRTCATNQAITAQKNARPVQKPVVQPAALPPAPSGGVRPARN
jgi:hypothetical protein